MIEQPHPDPLEDIVNTLHRGFVAILEDDPDTLDATAETFANFGFKVATARGYDEARKGPVTLWFPSWSPSSDVSPRGPVKIQLPNWVPERSAYEIVPNEERYVIHKFSANVGFLDLNPDLLMVDYMLTKPSTAQIDPHTLKPNPKTATPDDRTGLEYAIYFQNMEGNTIGEHRPTTEIFILSATKEMDASVRAAQLGMRYFVKFKDYKSPEELADLAMGKRYSVRIGIPETARKRLDVVNLLARRYQRDTGKKFPEPAPLYGETSRAVAVIKKRIPMAHGAYLRINSDDAVAMADVYDPNQSSSSANAFVIKKADSKDIVDRMHAAWLNFYRRNKRFPQMRYYNEGFFGLNPFLSGISGYHLLSRKNDMVAKRIMHHDKADAIDNAYLNAVLNWIWEWDAELRNPTRVNDGYVDKRKPLAYTADEREKVRKDTVEKLGRVYASLAGFNENILNVDPSNPLKKPIDRLKQAIDFSAALAFGEFGINWKLDVRSQNIVFLEDKVSMSDREYIEMSERREKRGFQRSLTEDYGQYEIGPRCEDRFRFEDIVSVVFAPELGHFGTGLPRSQQVSRLTSEIKKFKQYGFSDVELAKGWHMFAEGGFFTSSRNTQIIGNLYVPRLLMAFWQGLIEEDQFYAQIGTYQREQDHWFSLVPWFAKLFNLTSLMQATQSHRNITYQQVEGVIRVHLTDGAERVYARQLDANLAAHPLPATLHAPQEKALAPYNFTKEFREFYNRDAPFNLVRKIDDRAA